MEFSIAKDADNPYGQQQKSVVVHIEEEDCVLNWIKLLSLVLLTYGLIVSMWFIRYYIFYSYTVMQFKLWMDLFLHLG